MQLETIERNNQILNNLGSLDSKMDSVSSRVDSIGFGVQSVQEKVQDILEQQDSHNKKVRALACIRSITSGSDRKASLRFSVQVEGVLQRAARREDKTERLKRESVARDAVLSMYADRFAYL